MLSTQEIILLAIVGAALLLIVSNRIRADIAAILVLLALALTGLVTPQEAISGFSRSAVITLIGLFIITESLEDTGVVQWIANRLREIGRGSEVRLIMLFMGAGALLSLMMNNVAAAAVLLPAAVQVGRDSDVKLSKLLIPLSFGTLVGGMATYFTTANIVISGILQDQGQSGLGMVDFIPTGGLIVIAALIYMAFIGRRLLPERETLGHNLSPRSLSRNLFEAYHLEERLWEVRVPPGSRLVNTPISHSHVGEELGITILALWRGTRAILSPPPTEIIHANDYLLLLGRRERVDKLVDWGVLVGRENTHRNGRHDYSVDLSEVIIPPRSSVIGKTLKELRFRNKFGMTSVALWREGGSYRTDVGVTPLQVGDALLMVGPAAKIKSLAQERDFMVLESSHIHQPPKPEKAAVAVLITAVVLFLAILDIIPVPLVMLGGGAAMVLAGCINADEAYRAVEWRVVFLIAGMLPISIAMDHTGLATRLGSTLIHQLLPYGHLALIAGGFFLAVIIAQFIGGQVTSLIVGPIAVATALEVGINPEAMGVAVAIACSCAFLTPISHAVNVLVMGPGAYKFTDFFKVGLGMTIVTFIFLMIGMVVFWGIR
ncbi:MAG: SLC13 family permease [Chloroflexota bacterium]